MDNATEPDDIPQRIIAYINLFKRFKAQTPKINTYGFYKRFFKEFSKFEIFFVKNISKIRNLISYLVHTKNEEIMDEFHMLIANFDCMIDSIPICLEQKNLELLQLGFLELNTSLEKNEKLLIVNYFELFQNDQFLEDLKSYINVAEATVSSPSAAVFLRAIESNISSYQRRTERPFSAIIGPSFMGKTQMAFILAAFKYPVLYFNFSASESDQNVYRNFSEISKYMYRCLLEDLRIFFPGFKDYISPATSELLELEAETNQYKSLGFIYALIERASKFNFDENPWLLEYYKLEPIYYESMCINDFNAKYGNYALILFLFLFI